MFENFVSGIIDKKEREKGDILFFMDAFENMYPSNAENITFKIDMPIASMVFNFDFNILNDIIFLRFIRIIYLSLGILCRLKS